MSEGQGSSGNVLAAICSFFIPGLGQLVQGRLLKAIVMFVLAAVLWIAAGVAAAQLAHLSMLRDETALALLIVIGSIVYAGSILLLFGRGWLRSLVRS